VGNVQKNYHVPGSGADPGSFDGRGKKSKRMKAKLLEISND